MSWKKQLTSHIKELRFLFCQTSPASSATRSFLAKNYTELKQLNPRLPILIRECNGTVPQLWARYDKGVEKSVNLDGVSEEKISMALKEFVEIGKRSDLKA